MKQLRSRAWYSGKVVFGVFSVLASTVGSAHAEKETVSQNGVTLTIGYFAGGGEDGSGAPTQEPGLDVERARVCAEKPKALTSAVLWMPDHGHGSSPTRVVADAAASGRCFWIEDVEFIMPGDWEIRLQFADDDRAVFKLHIHGDHGH